MTLISVKALLTMVCLPVSQWYEISQTWLFNYGFHNQIKCFFQYQQWPVRGAVFLSQDATKVVCSSLCCRLTGETIMSVRNFWSFSNETGCTVHIIWNSVKGQISAQYFGVSSMRTTAQLSTQFFISVATLTQRNVSAGLTSKTTWKHVTGSSESLNSYRLTQIIKCTFTVGSSMQERCYVFPNGPI